MLVSEDVAATAAERVIALRPRTIALAGGRTPRALYERLAGAGLPWASMALWFGDERCVAADHPDSNERMARGALLDHVPAEVHPMPGEACDAAGYERELRAAFGAYGADVPRFDLVLLGLGADGHTASLFPGDPAIEERERLVARVERPDHARLTLTLPVLSAAAEALFLVTGASKREALRELLDGGPIPAARVRAGRVLVIADREAAL
ncbi:MAG: 6-phosphogluconolactonase [Chloroflexi bacterium]|nr:6-phosphogluconolactonase [Chloroflexota bacterium]